MKANIGRKILVPLMAAAVLASCSEDFVSDGGSVVTYDPESIVLTMGVSGKLTTRADGYTDREASEADYEATINGLDIFIFRASDEICVYHGYYAVSENLLNNKQATLALSKKRSDFDENTAYRIFAVANARQSLYNVTTDDAGSATKTDDTDLPEAFAKFEDESNGKTISDLRQLSGKSYYIHLSNGGGDLDTECFLMDGEATESDADGKETTNTSIVLNNGQDDDAVYLHTVLYRAAAKIRVTLKAGTGTITNENGIEYNTNVRFPERLSTDDEGNPATYNYRLHGRYDTRLLAAESRAINLSSTVSMRTTTPTVLPNDAVSADEGVVSFNTYTYSHEYTSGSLDGNETYLTVRVPIEYKQTAASDDDEEEDDDSGDESGSDDDGWEKHYNNFYKIPVGEIIEAATGGTGRRISRNTIYDITATISAPGATEELTTDELEVAYTIWEWGNEDTTDEWDRTGWIDKEEDVEGATEGVQYLVVSQKTLIMRNISSDETISFASSSNVSFEVTSVTYENKFGNEVDLSAADSLAKYSITASAVDASDLLNGYIKITSNVPTNHLIRTITIRVKNEQEMYEDITVTQYPAQYITFELGWFSYRTDFNTSYFGIGTANGNNPGMTVWKGETATTYNGSFTSTTSPGNLYFGATISNGAWSLSTRSSANSEKQACYATRFRTSNNRTSTDLYPMSYYYWSSSGNTYTRNTGSAIGSGQNPRMYHMYVTSTSSNYVVGIPSRDSSTDYTNDDDGNAKKVSPSLIVASELGATMNVTSYSLAQSHCKNYVEVSDENGELTTVANVYDDWRLPTRAEVAFIIDYQRTATEAMTEVFERRGYWCAGNHYNNNNTYSEDEVPYYNQYGSDNYNTGSAAVRCVRDAK